MAQHIQEDIRTVLIAQTRRDSQMAPATMEYPQAGPASGTEKPLSCYWYREIDEASGESTLRRTWWHQPNNED